MSKAETDQIDALTGGAKNPADAAAGGVSMEDYERTKHELDNSRGRLKSLDARLKELEKENAELRASKSQEELVSSALTEEERANLDPAFLSAMAKMNAATEARLRRENEERDRQEAEAREARMREAKSNFAQQIESAFPGFLSSIGTGGGSEAAWREFCRIYGASVNAAYERFDVDAISHLIRQFNAEQGIRVPSGSQGKATSPDPRNLGSGTTVASPATRNYTEKDVNTLFDEKEAARDRGDWAEVRRLTDEINKAQAQGGAQQ